MSGIDPRRDPEYLRRKIRDLEKCISRMESARRLENATISNGRLRITGGGGLRLEASDGVAIFEMFSSEAMPEPDGDAQPVVYLRRNDGSLAMSLSDPLPNVDGYHQILRFWDRSGNEIWAEDTTSGTGLATPWLNAPLYPARFTNWMGSNLASYETIWSGWVQKTHPKLRMLVGHTSDVTGTTGEVRVLADGNVWGGPTAVGFAIVTTAYEADLPGDINGAVFIELQARRTAGTGVVRCVPQRVVARQS